MGAYRRVLVTGGAGFIGSHLCDALIERGDTEVICMDNLETGDLRNIAHLRDNPLFRFFPGHIASSLNVREAIEGCSVVYHQAALKMGLCKTVAAAMKYNAQGTYIVALEAARCGARMVHASTGSVYGNSDGRCVAPVSIYGLSKAAGEMAVQMVANQYRMQAAIIRYHHVYGPRQSADPRSGGVIPIFILKLLKGEPITIHGDGLQTRRFIHVKDIVAANIYYSGWGRGTSIVNALGERATTIIELAMLLAKLLGVKDFRITQEPAREGDIRDFSSYPISNIYQRIGLEDGLIDTINYWKERTGNAPA